MGTNNFRKLLSFAAAMLLAAGALFAQTPQTSDIKGTVVDSSNQPVAGASVVVIGTMKGTITDLDGNFSLSGVKAGADLSVDFLGYKTQTVSVNGRSVISVVLEDDSTFLDEVVVVGYGQMKKSDLTGSVASVKPESLTDVPAKSVDGLLQGRVAGVQVINASQDPGASSTIRIRGNSSLNGSNSPLVVIDGFPYGDAGAIDQINPQDIVSMEVLKDASASAIYGSRGANGVIMITTRKAKQNVTKITLRQQTTISEFSSRLNLWRDPVLMAELSNEAARNAGITETYIGAKNAAGVYYPSIYELQTTWDTNTAWDDICFRTPVSDNTTIQIQSANDRTVFLASANYFRDNGMYVNDSYTKYGGNFSVEHKVYDNFSMKASANITSNKRIANNGLAYWRNPIFPVYNEDGTYFQYSPNDYSNPVALRDLQKKTSSGLGLISFVSADWQALPCLNIHGQVNYRHGESVADAYYPKKYSESGTFNNGYGSITNSKDDNIVVDTYMTFDKTFAEKHHFTAMAGYSYESYQYRGSFLAAKDFVNEALGNENLASGNPETYSISNSLTKTELVSGLVRLNYSYDDRYLATFTARADGSSKFGADNKWAFFPSGALSWKINNEGFLRDVKEINVLKLRASYGISGNQGIAAYQTLGRYGQHKYYNEGSWVTAIGPGYKSGTTGQGGIYAVWSGIANTGLKWETTAQADLGLDASFFDNRLNITFDWYDKKTSDLLRERNIAPSSGYDKMWVNDGEILNRGVELTLDGIMFQNRDWSIGSTLILSHNKNRVLSLGSALEAGLNTDPITGMQFEYYGNSREQYRAYTNILAVGQPLFVFYGYKTDGIVQSLAEGLSSGLVGDDAQPGEFKYVDIDGSETVDEGDRTIIGDPNPDLSASLAFNVSWKNLDFSVFFNGVFGNDVVNTKRFGEASNSAFRWTPDNRTNDYPRLNSNRQTKFSDWWIEDGSFVRVQTMSVGYNIPFKKGDLSRKVRLYMSADNLYTFTKFTGYDPEVSQLGVYTGGYPRLRKWTFGVDFVF